MKVPRILPRRWRPSIVNRRNTKTIKTHTHISDAFTEQEKSALKPLQALLAPYCRRNNLAVNIVPSEGLFNGKHVDVIVSKRIQVWESSPDVDRVYTRHDPLGSVTVDKCWDYRNAAQAVKQWASTILKTQGNTANWELSIWRPIK